MNREVIVVKIGGAEGNDGDGLIAELAEGGADRLVVVVHGGSGETDRLSAQLGMSAETILSPSGHESRLTDRAALEVFCQATALVNRRLVERARGAGIDAFGLSGLDGGLVRAERKECVRAVVNGRVRVVRDQWTGRITGVRSGILTALAAEGVVPFIAPLACGARGEMLNVDGDRLAAAIAVALGASALVLLTNVEGLRADPADPDSLMSVVGPEDLERARASAAGRMRRKVLGAEEALEGGVSRVVIASSGARRPLSAALEGAGTTFHREAQVGADA